MQKPWDEYETVLLIDTCVKVLNKAWSPKEAIRRLSGALRKRAIDAGLEIDDVYRNEAGISYQLSNMQQLLVGDSADVHCSKIFRDIAEMYRNNRTKYDVLLIQAKGGSSEMKSKRSRNSEP